jgi:KamA family protein
MDAVAPMPRAAYLTRPSQLEAYDSAAARRAEEVCRRYAFRASDHYLKLIDWDDPDDPIRRIIVPHADELVDWGRLDASHESRYARAPGLEHKYQDTALLLVNDVCGGFCRFCFRKRLFMNENTEAVRDVSAGLAYIRAHEEISNVLLTGGDALLLSTARLDKILAHLRRIDHVRIIRIGTKIPAFNPSRILDDSSLASLLGRYSQPRQRLYCMVHFNHARELTGQAIEAIRRLQRAGVIVANQTPLLRGVNDHPAALAELMNELSYTGIAPYYVFQGRPTAGNRHFAVPVERTLQIFEQARQRCSGLAKRARLVMSHATGKIEIVGATDSQVVFRYHRAVDPARHGRFMMFRRNAGAFWFDDYEESKRICVSDHAGLRALPK